MELTYLAQGVGLIGYILLVAAPNFKRQDHMIHMEMLACLVLSLQWALLAQPSLIYANVFGIAASLLAVYAPRPILKETGLLLLYPFCLAFGLLYWPMGPIDILVIIALWAMITSRRYDNILTYRLCMLTSGSALLIAGGLAFSVPALVFNTLFVAGHMLKLLKYMEEKQANLAPIP